MGGALSGRRLSRGNSEAAAQPHAFEELRRLRRLLGRLRRSRSEANAAHIETLFSLWREGRIAPKVSRTWPLEQAGEAIAHMAARKAVGKLVVTMD
jgi:NADPH:quinone reductase-like Zn-dependent oxidoreductase